MLAVNTASIVRSLRRVERMEHHRLVGSHLMTPPMAPTIAKYARSIHRMSREKPLLVTCQMQQVPQLALRFALHPPHQDLPQRQQSRMTTR